MDHNIIDSFCRDIHLAFNGVCAFLQKITVRKGIALCVRNVCNVCKRIKIFIEINGDALIAEADQRVHRLLHNEGAGDDLCRCITIGCCFTQDVVQLLCTGLMCVDCSGCSDGTGT